MTLMASARRLLALVTLIAAVQPAPQASRAQESAANDRSSASVAGKQALLVGCTDYVRLNGMNLRGPSNDVREMAAALISRFGFSPTAVRQLVGWPDDVALRPTRANILRELAALRQRVGPGSQVVVYFSGHGTRVPIAASQSDPLAEANPEPDGFDEAFVAADAAYNNGSIENLLLDNEIGGWLDQLRGKGAHVWAMFDCCHSGTMSRGTDEEQSREVTAAQFGMPEELRRRAEAKGQPPGRSAEVGDALLDFPEDNRPGQAGALVAFYAAQPFERAPDLPCPANAPKRSENYFGLLTYTTLQSLMQQREASQLTYRELGQQVISRYRAERGTRGPTPTFAGDIDREVLGFRQWPGKAQLVLRRSAANWLVNAGELHGLAANSILAVFPPGSAALDGIRPVGYVKIVSTTPTTSVIEPCEFDKTPAVAADQLQELMRCEVKQRRLGGQRIRLAIGKNPTNLSSLEMTLREPVRSLAQRLPEYVELVEDETAAWRLIGAEQNAAGGGAKQPLEETELLLVRRGAEQPAPESTAAGQPKTEPVSSIYARYRAEDSSALLANLESDLLKIFAWQNLWRLGSSLGNLAPPSTDLVVDLVSVGNSTTGDKPALSKTTFHAGERLELRVKNNGTDRLWVTLIFLDADFRIHVWPTQQLNRPGETDDALQPIRFEIAARRSGIQAWLVLASSAEFESLQPDYRFLAQRGVGQSLKRRPEAYKGDPTSFETVFLAVAGLKGGWRGEGPSLPATTPTMVIRSWLTNVSESPLP